MNLTAASPLKISGFREPGVWEAAWKLMRMRAVVSWNGFRRAKLRRKIGIIALGLCILAFLAFVVFLSITLLMALRSPDLAELIGDTTPFLDRFPSLMLGAGTVGILMTSFGVMLQALYLSGDMDFLMSAPIPMRSIFLAKLIEGILPNFGILSLFSLPLLFGLGISGGYSWFYYPLAVILLAALTLAAAGLASLLVMLAARVFPARRIAEVIGFVAGTGIFIFSQSARFINFDVGSQQLSAMIAMTERFNQPWSPLSWAGNGLTLVGRGNYLPGFGLALAGLLVACGVFYAALETAQRLYYTGWASLQNNRSGRKKSTARAASSAAPAVKRAGILAGLLPAPVRAIIAKDWMLYRRDLRDLSRLVTPLILGVVYAFGLVQTNGKMPEGGGDAPAWMMSIFESIYLYADVGLALFMGWMFAANIAGAGFTMEGKRYWMLKTAPLSTRILLLSKFLVSYLPTLALCSVYILILQVLKGFNLWNTLAGLLATASILAGLTGIYLGFGVAGARFDWTNPADANRGGGCLGALVGMLYAPLCFALFIGPAIGAVILQLPVWSGQVVGLVLGAGAGAAGVTIPLGMVYKRVETLMEA